MRKIPTLFVRDENDRRHVTDQVAPGCEWVLAGEGQATRKYDGTCVMLDDSGAWWARREVKPGKATPDEFIAIGTDDVTGKTVGWESIHRSSFARWLQQALEDGVGGALQPGTYELIGPKINGNPERRGTHEVVRHADAEWIEILPHDLCFDGLRATLRVLHEHESVEGIVWHHPDGRMAKLKARDFPAAS